VWIVAALAISGWGIAGTIIIHAITSWSETAGKSDSQPEGRAREPSIIELHPAEERHRAAERSFWERQIRVAKGLNWITLFAGIVAVGGLVALYRSITDAEDATIRANRAWLMADHVSIIPGTNAERMKTIQAWFEITNIGKEPASDVRTYIKPFWLTPVKNGNSIDMDMQKYNANDTCEYTSKQGSLGVVWPRPIPVGEQGPIVVADPGFENGSMYYGFQGCVSYYTFSTLHYTRFCEVLVANGSWSLCQGQGQQWAN
jgi:hypothetical protein